MKRLCLDRIVGLSVLELTTDLIAFDDSSAEI